MEMNWLKNLARVYMPVYKYETDTMKIAYAGYSSIKKNYCFRMLLGENNQHTFLGRRWFWRIPYLIKSHNLDMVISETTLTTLNHFQKCDGYVLPIWIEMRIKIDRPIDEICPNRISHFANIKRKIRKYNLTYEILTDKDSYNYYFDKFYVPYITKRYGEEASNLDVDYWDSSSSPFLIAIKENEVIVAISLNCKSGDSIKLRTLGLLDGKEEYLHHGVVGALYYFSILESQKMGCRYYNLGGSRPFLTDGLTKYKMWWGAEIVTDHPFIEEFIWLGINEHSSAFSA